MMYNKMPKLSILILFNIFCFFNFSCIPQQPDVGDEENLHNDHRYIIKVNNKYGYIDVNGNVIIKPEYEDARIFVEELAPVSINGSWGFIDKSGNTVIQPIYDSVLFFSEGLAAVSKNKKWGFIDKKGNLIIMIRFDEVRISGFTEGLSAVRLNYKFGYINVKGEFIIAPEYDDVDSFQDSFATAGYGDPRKGYKYGLIDKKGNKIIDFIYDNQLIFDEGLMAIKKDDLVGYMDRSGKMAIEPKYPIADPFFEGMAAIAFKYGHWGYLDTMGLLLLDLKNFEVELASKFKEGLAGIKTKDGYGFIDKNGNMVIQPKYSEADDFSDGLASVAIDKKYGYINTKGEVVVELKYTLAFPFEHGLGKIFTRLGGLGNKIDEFGYVNRKGKVIWEPKG
jgi:hypothetical protein